MGLLYAEKILTGNKKTEERRGKNLTGKDTYIIITMNQPL